MGFGVGEISRTYVPGSTEQPGTMQRLERVVGSKISLPLLFNLSLPEFMARFNSIPVPIRSPVETVAARVSEVISLESSWRALESRRPGKPDVAAVWLQNTRGIERPRETTYSGFESITVDDAVLFPRMQQAFLKNRLAQGSFLAAPIRSAKTGQVCNLLLRQLDAKDKADKIRLLPGCGGWSDSDDTPRGYGLTHFAAEAPVVVLCEGLVDTLSAEALLHENHNVIVIGSPSAQAMPRLGDWLAKHSAATVVVLFHLDLDPKTGRLSASGVGQKNAAQAVLEYRQTGKKAHLFSWPDFLAELESIGVVDAMLEVRDLGDVMRSRLKHNVAFETIQAVFEKAVTREIHGG